MTLRLTSAMYHRFHAPHDLTVEHVTYLSGDPSTAERAIDVYKMAVLPRIQQFDGFCSASFMINRETGRAVGTATFETRQQLEATREASSGIREGATREMGARVDDVIDEGGRPGQDNELAAMEGQETNPQGQQGQPEERSDSDGARGGNR